MQARNHAAPGEGVAVGEGEQDVEVGWKLALPLAQANVPTRVIIRPHEDNHNRVNRGFHNPPMLHCSLGDDLVGLCWSCLVIFHREDTASDMDKTTNEEQRRLTTERDAEEEAELQRVAVAFHRTGNGPVLTEASCEGNVYYATFGLSYALPPIRVAHQLGSVKETGGVPWPGGQLLTPWLLMQLLGESRVGDPAALAHAELLPALRHVDSAVELGAGLGIVSLALARSGRLRKVVATDGDAGCCANCELSASVNGLAQVLAVSRLEWGEHAEAAAQVAEALQPMMRCTGAPGKESSTSSASRLLVMADVIYETSLFTSRKGVRSAALAATVRALVERGEFTHVIQAWANRMGGEEAFLSARLADLGDARTVCRVPGRVGGDVGITVLEVRRGRRVEASS